MKIIYLILTFTLMGSLFSETSFISGFLNDNYTGTTENGINGNYIGADDFLTLSLFAKSVNNNLSISEYYQVVTSRKYEYRYDLLESDVEYFFKVDDFILRPKLLIIYKGEYSGEYVQNSIHEFKSLPLLELDYTDSAVSLGLGGTFEYVFNPLVFRLDLEFPYSIKPMYSMFTLNYTWESKYIDIDLVSGYKQYINSVDEYSQFVESGYVGGMQAVIKPYKSFTVNAGAFFFNANNLENDVLYKDIDHSFSPQFWVTFGLNGGLYSILDVVDF